MAITIPSIMLAIKDASSCGAAVNIASSFAGFYKSSLHCLVFGNEGQLDAAKFPNIKVSVTNLGDANPLKEIIKQYKASDADLLIIPTSTGPGTNGLFTFAEANKIIDAIERMVLTVPCLADNMNVTDIVVPIDTSFETRQKVPYAVSVAMACNAKLHIIGVSNDAGKDSEVVIKNYTRQVKNNIEEKGLPCSMEIRLGGNPTNQIINYAKDIKASMILIMTEQETNFTSFFTGKYSEQMIKNSTIPVLSIHPKDLIISDARL